MLDKILGCRESLVTCTALIGAFLLYVSFNTSSHVVLLPACVMKPLEMIQHAVAHLVFNQPKRAHVTPLLIALHWLPVAARIKFKSLMLAATGSQWSSMSSGVTCALFGWLNTRRAAAFSILCTEFTTQACRHV